MKGFLTRAAFSFPSGLLLCDLITMSPASTMDATIGGYSWWEEKRLQQMNSFFFFTNRWILKRLRFCIYLSRLKKIQRRETQRCCDTRVELWLCGMLFKVLDGIIGFVKKLFFFSPRWLHKFRGGSTGWISTYGLKKLEHKYSVQHFCTEPFAFLWLWNLHSFYFRILKINIFIFGCTGSSLLRSLSPAVCTGFSPR